MKKSSLSPQDFETTEISLFEESFSLKNSVRTKLIKLSGIAKSLQEDLTKNSNSWQNEKEILSNELNELKTKFTSLYEEHLQLKVSSDEKVKNLEQDLSQKKILLRETSTELKKTKDSLLTAENLNTDLITLVDSLKEEDQQKTLEFSRRLTDTDDELKNAKVELKIAINDLGKILQEKHFLETQFQKTRETSDFLSKKLSDKDSLFYKMEGDFKEKILGLEAEVASLKKSNIQWTEMIHSLQEEVFHSENRINSLKSEKIILSKENDELLRKFESGHFLSFEERSILQNQIKMVLETIEDELEELHPEE